MPCIDLGLDVYDDEFTSPTYATPYTVTAPEGKKFISASWQLCYQISGPSCDCEGNPNSGNANVTHKPNDDLTEWTFWTVPVNGNGTPNKLKVRMVTIDA